MVNTTENITGSCLCRAVTYEVTGPLRDIIMCHCVMCQKTSGHHYAASATATDTLKITENGALKWFESSRNAKRGFCQECGSSLFWHMVGRDEISILMGSLDSDVDLPVTSHLFVREKKKYYKLDDDIFQYETYPEDY